jgi:threonine dehydratase
MLLRTTHRLAEGAGAAGPAGLLARRERLAGRTAAIVLCGANIDEPTPRRVMNHVI